MKHKKIKLLALVLFFGVSTSYAQVSIGDRPTPDSAAILDLRNTSDLGLLLPTATVNPGALDDADVIPLGMLYYYEGNLFLKDSINTSSPTDDFTGVTPWKSIFTGVKPVNVYFNPTGYTGVGIGIDGSDNLNIKANLHVAKDGTVVKEVNVGATSASFLIGDSDADIHMELDNDEILVKTNTNTPGTLKLQEGGGTVQVGKATALVTGESVAKLNVYGAIQQDGHDLLPKGTVVMWYGAFDANGNPLLDNVANLNWHICDGSTGTPNLSGQFVEGVTMTPGTPGELVDQVSNGESNSKTLEPLTTAHLPQHNHGTTPAHGSTLVTATDGAHSHTVEEITDLGGGTGTKWEIEPSADDDGTMFIPAAGSAHSHVINGHTDNGYYTDKTTQLAATPTRVPYNVRPSAFKLAYIIKL